MAGTKRTKYDDEALDVIEARLKDALRIIAQTRNGSSMAEAIRKENLNMHNVRSLFGTALSMKVNDVPGELSVKSLDEIMYTPVELMYKDIFGYSDTEWLKCTIRLPNDAEETLRTVIEDLTEREKKCIELYYFEELTFEEVGKQFNVTRDRIRQIISKALRKLRNPSRSNILKIGLHEFEYIRQEKERIIEEARDKHLQNFKKSEEKRYADSMDINKILDTSIDVLELSVRSYNCLKRAAVSTLKDVIVMTDYDLMRVRNLGRKSMEEVKEYFAVYMKTHGYRLDDLMPIKEKLLGREVINNFWETGVIKNE